MRPPPAVEWHRIDLFSLLLGHWSPQGLASKASWDFFNATGLDWSLDAKLVPRTDAHLSWLVVVGVKCKSSAQPHLPCSNEWIPSQMRFAVQTTVMGWKEFSLLWPKERQHGFPLAMHHVSWCVCVCVNRASHESSLQRAHLGPRNREGLADGFCCPRGTASDMYIINRSHGRPSPQHGP